MFDLKSPCVTCPFRKGQGSKFQLSADRLREIHDAVAFQCHKTVDYDAEDRAGRAGDRPQQCAGLMTLLHRDEAPNQIMQVAQRLGALDPGSLDPAGEVYSTWSEACAAHGGQSSTPRDSASL